MPTMAQWGSKKWAVSSKQVVALEGLAFSYEQVADENTSTEDKKTTNERGTELFLSHSPPCCTQAQALTYGRRSRAGRLSSQK